MPKSSTRRPEELSADNNARIVLYDAMVGVASLDHAFDGLDTRELFDLVIPRLRVLVPRELHVQGEPEYVEAKISACIDAGILLEHPRRPGLLVLGSEIPKIRYPDGSVRDYTPGLEAARERLDADEARLRRGGFNVRDIVRSPAKDKRSIRYRNLVASMREHGFLEWAGKDRSYACFPIIESATGGIIDGMARDVAAKELGMTIKKHHRVRLPQRRDTPLQNALLVLDLNAERLSDEERTRVYEEIEKRVGRPWKDVEKDLKSTQEWRRAIPKDYDAKLDVKLLPFSNQQEPSVQVTTDGTRFMLRSIMRQAGIPEYRREDLLEYVPWEEARTQHSGRQAVFVRIADGIEGIARMQRGRESRGLKVHPGWGEVRRWLEDFDGRVSSPISSSADDGSSAADAST